MSQPLISIIVPCYNQAQYLDECLQSVIDQTYQNWECIIIDDGSPDHTGEIAKSWAERNSRFKYFRKENGGVSAARNFGIEKAEGEWILPLDGDDSISNQYLDLASKEFSDNDIVYCKGEYFGEKQGEIIVDHFNAVEILLENQIFCTAFFKKQDWKNTEGFDESMQKGYEDWDFWLGILNLKHAGLKVKKINYSGFKYRIKSTSRNTVAMQEEDLNIRKYLCKKYPELYLDNIKSFADIFFEKRKLDKQNQQLKKILTSKRHQFVDKIFNLLKI
ncbi:glycosyltransferase family A protein [Chryseobacterium sp. Leaf394]|uniref:glycosyltransferase family 2 protein n=1 Tax=Chryseobacterium sp. Leaf394 TaxID=1736361 RepID=UPI000701DDA5|nr:glycosyltransferase family A protein [Chryseobacterium sp. Leaf394]KQS95218.1 hypothetical protein ASG21_17410 [Chryseobacterium sp. Leaf394]